MKKKLLLILCSLILSFLIFSCDEEKPVEPTPTPPETIIADNTEQADSNTFKTGLVSVDSSQIIYSSSNSFTQRLVVGGFIVSDYGEGILRKIESIQSQGGQVLINTRQARLDEVIIKGKIEFHGQVPLEGIKLDNSNENISFKALGENIVIAIEDYKPLGNDNIIINAGTTFPAPIINFTLELNNGITDFQSSIKIQQSTFIETETTTSISLNFEYTPPFLDVTLTTIPTPIPLLFIVVKAKFGIGGQYFVSNVSMNEFTATTEVEAGFGFNTLQGPYPIFDIDQTFTAESNLYTLGNGLRGYIFIPKLGFYISGIIGPYINNELFVRYAVDEDNQGTYRGVWGGVAAVAGLETDLFGLLNIGIINLELFSQEWELWKNYINQNNTPPTAFFTMNPTSGNTNTIFDFDASGSTDNEDPVSALEVRWDWESDGNWDTQYSTNKTAAHQYSNTGNYIIRLQVIDTGGLTNSTTKTVVVTGGTGNDPPNEPSNPSPSDGAINVPINNTVVTWTCTDPNGDLLAYDVYFGTNSNPPFAAQNMTNELYNPGTLQENTMYYWKIVAKDAQNNSTSGPIWNFTTGEDGGGSGEPCPGVPTVYYEGKTYNTVLIGNQCWLKENLDVGTMIQGTINQTDNGTIEKYCFDNDPNNCNTYGGLYQWDEAMQYVTNEGAQGICPPGWHLPTVAEFQTLAAAVGNDGNSLKAIGQGTGGGAGTNTSGFSALLAGYRRPNSNFTLLGDRAYFWSSTAYYYLSLYYSSSNISLDTNPLTSGFSVRCLKD